MAVSSMPISETVAHVYPRLISLHDADPQSTEMPPMMRCSIERFADDGAYLLGKRWMKNSKVFFFLFISYITNYFYP